VATDGQRHGRCRAVRAAERARLAARPLVPGRRRRVPIGADDRRATEYCWEHAEEAGTGSPYTVRFVLDFLDAVPDRGRAQTLLDRLADRVPADGLLRVDAGTEGEVLRPLELAPWPQHAARRLFDDAVIERELDRLADDQQDDGGWTFTWAAWNPAVASEWRGAVTVLALRALGAYGRLELGAPA
jgi:hypothetical protein